METSFFNSEIFDYAVLPFLIFLARICDVSIGTMRIIFVSKGNRRVAPILGFFEVLIWIIAISKIMQNLDNYINYIAYAAGFATGNYVGMIIEERLAMGIQMIRVFVSENGMELVKNLNSNGFGATTIEAHGAKEKIDIIYSIVHRKELKNVINIITSFNSRAFFTIEDVKSANEGIFNPRKKSQIFPFANVIRGWRPGK
ncbi:MAG: DUF2179 domain-containing protein [Bacteroidales bacterium]|jgi:uncharacterized protein YebE (UPF0316 family)|nr:DUF2179 domain-containing protein [Bacteroidales bacterium]